MNEIEMQIKQYEEELIKLNELTKKDEYLRLIHERDIELLTEDIRILKQELNGGESNAGV